MSKIEVQIDTPFKTVAKFSADTGIPVGQVRKMIGKGDLEIMPKELPNERVLINMVAACKRAAEAAYLSAIS